MGVSIGHPQGLVWAGLGRVGCCHHPWNQRVGAEPRGEDPQGSLLAEAWPGKAGPGAPHGRQRAGAPWGPKWMEDRAQWVGAGAWVTGVGRPKSSECPGFEDEPQETPESGVAPAWALLNPRLFGLSVCGLGFLLKCLLWLPQPVWGPSTRPGESEPHPQPHVLSHKPACRLPGAGSGTFPCLWVGSC